MAHFNVGPIHQQRMNAAGLPSGPAIPVPPVASIVAISGSIGEGEDAKFQLNLDGDLSSAISIKYTPQSAKGDADLKSPGIKTLNVPANTGTVPITIGTVNRSGAQGTRQLTVTLSAPSGCTINPKVKSAACTITEASVSLQDHRYTVTAGDAIADFDVLAGSVPAQANLQIISKSALVPNKGVLAIKADKSKLQYTPPSALTDDTDVVASYVAQVTADATKQGTGGVTFSVLNNAPGGSKWWILPSFRSGRLWASGPSYWYKDWTRYESDVAKIDAANGGMPYGDPKTSVNLTMQKTLGGRYDVADSSIERSSQADWAGSTGSHWWAMWNQYPRGIWLVWCMNMWSEDFDTSDGNGRIFTEILKGTYDIGFTNLGRRMRENFLNRNPQGHSPDRMIVRMNHEMNQSNYYQVFAGTRMDYARAMSRAISFMRIGLGDMGNKVKFLHAPANGKNIGAYKDWVPSECDILMASTHIARPNAVYSNVTAQTGPLKDPSIVKLDKYIDGTDGGYGLDVVRLAGVDLKLPMAFSEWSPQNDWDYAKPPTDKYNKAYPFADEAYRHYYKWFSDNRGQIACECVYSLMTLDKNSYKRDHGDDPIGVANWKLGVDVFKNLWGGITNPP